MKVIIFEPSQYLSNVFPSMRKYDDATGVSLNDASIRPLVMCKFSEISFIDSEATFKLSDNTKLGVMLNVIRQRAAYKSMNPAAQNAAAVTAVTILPSNVILDLFWMNVIVNFTEKV